MQASNTVRVQQNSCVASITAMEISSWWIILLNVWKQYKF
jgi:hypothetical protein